MIWACFLIFPGPILVKRLKGNRQQNDTQMDEDFWEGRPPSPQFPLDIVTLRPFVLMMLHQVCLVMSDWKPSPHSFKPKGNFSGLHEERV